MDLYVFLYKNGDYTIVHISSLIEGGVPLDENENEADFVGKVLYTKADTYVAIVNGIDFDDTLLVLREQKTLNCFKEIGRLEI